MKLMFFLLWSLFLISSHPMMKIISFVINMLLTLFLISFLMKSNWMFMIFSLLIISGLMVIFIYFTSLKSAYSSPKNFTNFSLASLFILMILKLNNFSTPFAFNSFFPLYTMMNLYNNMNSNILMTSLMVYIVASLLWNIEIISNMKSSFRSTS